MKVLVVGGGGREHALVRRIAASPLVDAVHAAPGNPGIAAEPKARCHAIGVDALDALVALARDLQIDLTIVGPEAPLVAGLVDRFLAAGLTILGPTAAAAALEGSKAFAKEIMLAAGVPTAEAQVFTALAPALEALAAWPEPQVVVKADGLAAGKGVVVAADHAEAEAALRGLFEGRLGNAGARVLLERFLVGDEVSVIGLCDGERAVLLPAAQDHKRIGEGDTGPNTGGMGTYAPAPVLDAAGLADVQRRVFAPVLAEMARRGTPFRGFLFAGLMVGPAGLQVLEFNTRLGDPETQVMLALLAEDPVPAFHAAATGSLGTTTLAVHPGAHAACVVMAAQGYPDAPRKGDAMTLPDDPEGAVILHAGTRRDAAGTLRTDGGRVLGVTATGATLEAALATCYATCARVHFDGRQYRRDIGHRALGGRAVGATRP
jgi:phosphoribosylamine--glycine ligase